MEKIDISRIFEDSYIKYLADFKDAFFSFTFADGQTVNARGKWWWHNLILWRPLVKWSLPILPKHFYYGKPFTASVVQVIQDEIYRDIVRSYPDQAEASLHDLVKVIEDFNNYGILHLGAYHLGCSFDQFESILNHPEFVEASYCDFDSMMANGISAVEKGLEVAYNKSLKVLSNPKFRCSNVFYPYLKLKIVSNQQMAQVAVAGGTRTDVNEATITRPIMPPYIFGMESILDYIPDSLSAKKSVIYNAVKLSETQYNNRKGQLEASSIFKLYPGDCGSNITVPYEITQANAVHCIGKYYYKGTERFTITRDNYKDLVGQILHIRSAIPCRHTDGVCHACAGEMADYALTNSIIGISSAQELIGQITQNVLSNKHHSSSLSLLYSVPAYLLDYFYTTPKNEIYIKPNIKADNLILATPYQCVNRVNDLKYIKDVHAINDQYFSFVSELNLVNKETGEIITDSISMRDSTGTVPFLTSDLLKHLINNPSKMETGDTVLISLEGFDTKKPIMRSVTKNDSMPAFMKKIQAFFTKGISGYTSIEEALKDFTNLTYPRLNVNLFHIEIMLKTNLITAPGLDYRIPVVEDPNNVKFGTLSQIIPGRSIGTMMAFEKIMNYLLTPEAYIIPKPPGVFDPFIGLKSSTSV